MEKYYTQRLAEQNRRRIVPLPENISLDNVLHFRLTDEEFIEAYHAYIEILNSIYSGIAADPEEFGMICCEIEPYKSAVSVNEGKSIRSFRRLPETLLAVAELGAFTEDNGFAVSYTELKARKITKFSKIIEGISHHGVTVEQTGDTYIFYCDHNPNVFRVLKSFAETDIGTDIVTADYRYLLQKKDEIVFKPEDFVRLIPDGYSLYGGLILDICDKFAGLNYSVKTEYTYNPGRIRISKNTYGKEAVSIRIERDDAVYINIRLNNVIKNLDMIDGISENIMHQTLSGRDCINCGWCKDGGLKFSYNGRDYNKCSVICCNFQYSPQNEEDCRSIMKLIDEECKLSLKA